MKRIIVFILVVVFCLGAFALHAENPIGPEKKPVASGVCPPFYLKDEGGNIIDPLHNVNADKPYSPKQTCGTKDCHDYNKITEGFHFTQGKGEKVSELFAKLASISESCSKILQRATWGRPISLLKSII